MRMPSMHQGRANCNASSKLSGVLYGSSLPTFMRARRSLVAPEHRQPLPRSAWVCKAKDDEEPDWDKEMSIFNKRMSAPNQLATLRELEAKVNVGKVLFVKDSLAIVSGLNADAPLGTKLSFVTGGTGVLLWHRSDNIAFALILGGASAINVGTGLQCKIKGVLQLIDDVKGPVTKKEFEMFEVPVGEHLFGKVINFLGQPLPGMGIGTATPATQKPQAGSAGDAQGMAAVVRKNKKQAAVVEKHRPLLNTQVLMKHREQIHEPLITGVKALDLLTPVGRGASLLVIGSGKSGKSTLAEDAVLGQRNSGVHCVYASTSRPLEEVRDMEARLTAANAMATTCVVACSPTAPLGDKYATMCAAFSIGEAVRDRGGHCMVVVDTMAPLSELWDTLAITGLSGLGQQVARQGLIKDSQGRDLALPQPETDNEQELVDYEGMLVSGAVAQRRGFFSTLFMRPAKMSKGLGGGSLSALMLVPGRPATGVTKKVDMSKYQTLSEEQKAKIKAALEKKFLEESALGMAPGDLVTEAVEEFISIADGQLVLESRAASGAYRANPRLSITRIGGRAYPRALEVLAPQIRLGLVQAEDARKFKLDTAADPSAGKADALNMRMAEALTQMPGNPASLEEQVIIVLAVQKGHANVVPPEEVSGYLTKAVKFVNAAAPQALQEIRNTRMLTATAEKAINDALADLSSLIKKGV